MKVLEMTPVEAKTRFGEVLDAVERGDEVIVTRRGKKVARIRAADRRATPEEIQEAFRKIREVGLRLEPGETIKGLISQGRR
jgi:prevent-host-death family protein